MSLLRITPLASFAFFLTIALILLLAPSCWAQLPQASDTTSPPTLGVGHDYIQAPGDTVNPGNGLPSIRIPLRVPPGRELTIPLSIAYDSAGAFYYGEVPGAGGTNAPGYNTITNVPFSSGGWSYTFPIMTNTRETWVQTCSDGRPCTCNETVNYVLQDLSGNRHNMGLVAIENPPQKGCGNAITPGGEGPILATLSGPTPTVTDGNGTLYSFPAFTYNPNYRLPTSITDRNGNTVSISSTSSSATVTDTVGRAAISVGTFGANPDTLTIAGLSSPYQVYWTTASASFTISQTNLQPGVSPNCPTSLSGSANVISQIVLPNGQKFTFIYDSTYGMLTRITYPTGGYVRYTWGLNSQPEAGIWSPYICRYDFPAITDRYVSFDGSTEVLHQHFAYNTSWPGLGFNYTSKTTTVTTYDLVRNTNFTTVYAYAGVSAPCVPDQNPDTSGCLGSITAQIPLEQCIEYYDASGSGGTPPSPCPNLNPPGKLLKTVIKSWFNSNTRTLGSEQTTLDNGQSSLTVYCYNANEQVTEIDKYDFGATPVTPPSCSNGLPSGTAAGPLLRATVTSYATFGSNHIVDRPASVIVYSDSAKTNRVAETDYTYDNPVGTTTSGIVQHSGGCNCGNLTKVSRWVNGSGTTLNTTYTNDDTGQRLTMIDPRGNQTTYSYADSYSSGTPPGPTNAYLTTITYPNTGVAHVEKFAYAYASGEVTSSADENGQNTTYVYNDPLIRLTETDFSDGGKTTISFNDSPYSGSTPSPSVTTTRAMTWSTNMTTLTAFDGLGHTVRSVLTSDPDCASGDRTDTTYDGPGRVYTVSNPYCSTSDPAYGVTTYAYDALGRIAQITRPDGATVLTTYAGRATQVQDEGNGVSRVTRISQTDALGRLGSLCEVSSASLIGSGGTPSACGQDIAGTGFLTTYQYDTLGNLTQVNQSGVNPRTFSYDSLSRLTSATNPESGQICYGTVSAGACQANGYDANSNLVTKTDARGITTTYSYDALNRLTGKTYSDGTPAVTFNYDQSSALGVALTNTIGRRSSQSTAGPNATGSVFSYDTMGRISNNSQCTPQNCGIGVFALQYTQYDFVGDLVSATNAAGVTFSYAYNAVARLTGISSNFIDASHPGTLFSNAHYNPFGFLTGDTLGNGVTESWSYNKRGWQQSRTATVGATTPYSFSVGAFAPNGNILAANDSANQNWVFAYDAFNRLTCSNLATNGTCAAPTSGTPTYSYDYDRFGNRWHQNGPYSSQLGFDANNRITGVTGVGYDLAGNLTSSGLGAHTYFYDAENRIVQVDGTLGNCATATACYVYNADGQRVRKTTGASSMDHLYDLSGNKVAEVDPRGVFMRGEIYASGRHFAIFAPEPGPTGATFFTHTDWLGTERVRTDMTGTNCESIASLPFGDGQSITGTCGDVSPMHFTGKERDSESGLDNFIARYDSSSLGRFMSPDPGNAGAIDEDPQTWNAYSYVRNNPLNLTDPDGLRVRICDTTNHCTEISDADFKKYFSDAQNVKVDKDKIFIKDKNGDFRLAGTNQRISFDDPQGIESANGMNMFMFSPFGGLVTRGLSAAEGAAGSAAGQGGADAASGASTGATSAAANQAAASGSQQAVQLTVHAAARAAQRGISQGEIDAAVQTAKAAGKVLMQVGKYGTQQEVYEGTNGVTVVVETAGRNAGKAITVWRQGTTP